MMLIDVLCGFKVIWQQSVSMLLEETVDVVINSFSTVSYLTGEPVIVAVSKSWVHLIQWIELFRLFASAVCT